MPKVLYETRGPIAYITLNRPDKLNAIDTETDELLADAWRSFRDDPDVRLAILAGSGEKAFCAGADLATHVDGWLNGGPDLGRKVLASADAQFGFYHMRRGMHFADGGIVRLVNTCGVGSRWNWS